MQEKNTVFINDKPVCYTLDRGKRKNTYLCISNGELVVKIPQRLPLASAEQIIMDKQDWIAKKLSRAPIFDATSEYVSGGKIYIFGIPYTLEVVNNAKKNSVEMKDDKLIEYISRGEVKTITEKYLESIFNLSLESIFEKMTSITSLTPNSFTTRKLSKSWGRCSSKGNISIAKKLVHYPIKAVEYVVLHELCHLKHMNHSKAFWKMVSQYMPDYKQAQAYLR